MAAGIYNEVIRAPLDSRRLFQVFPGITRFVNHCLHLSWRPCLPCSLDVFSWLAASLIQLF
jgi:hypothetical protein